MSTIDQVKQFILTHHLASLAAQGIEFAENSDCSDAEEFFSLAMSRILYSDAQLANGDRYSVEPGSLDDLVPAVDLSDWTIIDNRTDKAVEPATLFADASWVDKSADDYDASALQSASRIDDGDIHIYEIKIGPVCAYVARGSCVREITLVDAPMKWADVLADWDTGDSPREEILASFGLDATSVLDEADEDHDGPCTVWIERNFYAGATGNTGDGYYRDPEAGDMAPTEFDSYAEALQWVEAQDGQLYYLSNGEAGRPSYTICKA